jgi:hypothetical protein
MLSSVANNITTLCRDGQASDVLYTPFCLHAKFIAARHSACGWRFLSDEARSLFQKLAQDQSPHPKRKEAGGSFASKPKAASMSKAKRPAAAGSK